MKEGFFYRRLVRPILELLKQGVTPEKIALSIALGAAIGVLPALGWSTALCAVAALVLRLNLPAIQIVNYFMYPVQIVLIIPFFKLGARLFRAPHVPFSLAQINALFHAGVWKAINLLWTTIWHAVVVWSLLAPVFVLVAYMVCAPLLRYALRKQGFQVGSA
jgi:uncharacterized protein (DUF2062 family)